MAQVCDCESENIQQVHILANVKIMFIFLGLHMIYNLYFGMRFYCEIDQRCLAFGAVNTSSSTHSL